MNQRAELGRLVTWAERKRLDGPKRWYQSLFDGTEQALWRHRVRTPGAVRWAKLVYWLRRVVFPAPRYPTRGSAAVYTRKRLTQTRNNL